VFRFSSEALSTAIEQFIDLPQEATGVALSVKIGPR
jgi:hypothetical protein